MCWKQCGKIPPFVVVFPGMCSLLSGIHYMRSEGVKSEHKRKEMMPLAGRLDCREDKLFPNTANQPPQGEAHDLRGWNLKPSWEKHGISSTCQTTSQDSTIDNSLLTYCYMKQMPFLGGICLDGIIFLQNKPSSLTENNAHLTLELPLFKNSISAKSYKDQIILCGAKLQ